jgi:hypothetical protein
MNHQETTTKVFASSIYWRSILALFVCGLGFSFCSASAEPQDCERACLVEIDGLQRAYSAESPVKVVIRNRSKHDLTVNVAVEGLESSSWMEVVGSVSDPEHALAKTLVFKPVKTGASYTVAFNPCKTSMLVKTGDSFGLDDHPCAKSIADAVVPISLRLRVDVFIRGREAMAQRVRSPEFRLVPTS